MALDEAKHVQQGRAREFRPEAQRRANQREAGQGEAKRSAVEWRDPTRGGNARPTATEPWPERIRTLARAGMNGRAGERASERANKWLQAVSARRRRGRGARRGSSARRQHMHVCLTGPRCRCEGMEGASRAAAAHGFFKGKGGGNASKRARVRMAAAGHRALRQAVQCRAALRSLEFCRAGGKKQEASQSATVASALAAAKNPILQPGACLAPAVT